jgi:hypothetical protein
MSISTHIVPDLGRRIINGEKNLDKKIFRLSMIKLIILW